MTPYRPLSRSHLPRTSRALARALIGCILVRDSPEGRVAGRIVETEAYPPGDPACHAATGRSARNASLFGPPHRAYVYQIYGVAFCFNLASEEEGVGAGVLVRALEPLEGIELMQRRRSVLALRDLCRGPGRVCQALAIDRRHDGLDPLAGREVWIARPVGPPERRPGIRRSPRIGIRKAADRLLRYYVAGNSFVSGPRSLNPS